MLKNVSKIGNSQGIIFDTPLMEMAHLKIGDEVNISVHEGGSIIITPTRPIVTPEEGAASARQWIDKNDELFRRLSK